MVEIAVAARRMPFGDGQGSLARLTPFFSDTGKACVGVATSDAQLV
jgi:hypothetical protein